MLSLIMFSGLRWGGVNATNRHLQPFPRYLFGELFALKRNIGFS